MQCETRGGIMSRGTEGKKYIVSRKRPYSFGGIGFFNKEDSTRKGGTVQVRTSERIIRAERALLPMNLQQYTTTYTETQEERY